MVWTPETQVERVVAGDSGELGLAFFEYVFQVPANRIGSDVLSVTQLKILQECITLTVFTIVAYFMFGETLKWNNIVSYLFLVGAVVFAFWGKE